MFQAFYGLNDNPFSNPISSDNLFLSEHHTEALTCLNYGLNEIGGFVLITGEEGSGKTSVVNAFLKQVSATHDTALITNPSLSEHELLAKVCDKLNIEYKGNPSLKCFTDLLCQFLLNNDARSRSTVLIIDEAQHLSTAVLEQLRLLTNLETDTKKLLQLVLVGRPELNQMLRQEELRQVAQRITVRYHITSLSQAETGAYIQHHLRRAGHHNPLFARAALKAVHKYSGGLPSLINRLCEQALIIGHAQSRNLIDSNIISTAVSQTPEITIKPSNDRSLFATLTAMAVVTVVVLMTLTLTLTHSYQNEKTDQIAKDRVTEATVITKKSIPEPLSLDEEDLRRIKRQNKIATNTVSKRTFTPTTSFTDTPAATMQPYEEQGIIIANNNASYRTTKKENKQVTEPETEHALIKIPTEIVADASVDNNQSTKPQLQSWYVLQIYAGRTRPDDLTRFRCENINLLIRHHNETYYLTSQHMTLSQAKQAKRLMSDKCQVDTWIKPLPKNWQTLVASQG